MAAHQMPYSTSAPKNNLYYMQQWGWLHHAVGCFLALVTLAHYTTGTTITRDHTEYIRNRWTARKATFCTLATWGIHHRREQWLVMKWNQHLVTCQYFHVRDRKKTHNLERLGSHCHLKIKPPSTLRRQWKDLHGSSGFCFATFGTWIFSMDRNIGKGRLSCCRLDVVDVYQPKMVKHHLRHLVYLVYLVYLLMVSFIDITLPSNHWLSLRWRKNKTDRTAQWMLFHKYREFARAGGAK